jgi:CHAD domain-containing protein
MKTIPVIDKRVKKTGKYFRRVLKNFQAEDIHNFRLEIKKLRAFMRIAGNEKEGGGARPGAKITSFYHITGDIRNLQLHHQRIEILGNELFLPLPVNYMSRIRTEEFIFRKQAREEAEKISIRHFEKHCHEVLPSEFKGHIMSDYTLRMQVVFSQLLATKNLTDENLHEVRKTLKDLLYNRSFIAPFAIGVFPGLYDSEKSIEILAERLGDFHDLCVAEDFMKRSKPWNDKIPEENDVLTVLTEKLTEQKNDLKKEIIDSLEELKTETKPAASME